MKLTLKLDGPPAASTPASVIKQEKQKANESDLRHDLTTAELIDQLALRTDDIVSLGELVHRIVGQVFAQLEQLTEILPSKEDYERKQLLVRFIDEARKHLVRLLVVARWSAHARYVKRAQDVLGFLQQQTAHLAGTVDAVEVIRQQLTDVRLRNFDISTALDVLTTGSYSGAPAIIRQQLAGPERLPDELVRSTLLEIEEVLRYRLAVEEELPIPMRQYTIADGKAHFSVPSLFEVFLTLAGNIDQDPWLCLDVEFLPKTGPPGKYMKDELLKLAGEKLRRPSLLPVGEVDKPLRRLYAFLRDLSLDLRLERLAAEAGKLAAEAWKGSLRIALSREDRSLSVSYWINAMSPPAHRPPAHVAQQAPPVPPRIVVAVMERKPSAKALLEACEDEAPEVDQDLAWIWEPYDVKEALPGFEPLGVNQTVASLLEQVSKGHMDILCRQVIRDILDQTSPAFQEVSRSPLEQDGLLNGFREQLHGLFDLDILIDQHSGRFHLQPSAELSASLLQYIRGLESDVNGQRNRFVAALSQIRALVRIEAMEAQANMAGLTVIKITSLRSSDQDRVGATHHVLFLIPLVNSSPYYLLVAASPTTGPCFAVAAMDAPNEHTPLWSISDLAWIKTPALLMLTNVSADLLLDLHRYASVRAAHLRMEQQLASRLLPYERRTLGKAVKPDPLNEFPVLAMRLDDVLPNASFAHRAVAIRIEYIDTDKPCRVAFYMRLVKVSSALAKNVPAGCELDISTRMLVARFSDDPEEPGGGAFPAFLEVLVTLARLARSATLGENKVVEE